MAKLVRVYDPDETERRVNLILKDAVCPGLLEFMSELPYGNETPLIRGIFYQWFLEHSEAGTLDNALNTALSGPGGLIAIGSQGSREPVTAKPRKRIAKQRSVTARPGGRQPVTGQAEHGLSSQPAEIQEPLPAHLLAQPESELPQIAQPDPPVPVLPEPHTVEVLVPSPSAVLPTEVHSQAAAQVEGGNGSNQVPDADQLALLNSMGTLFP